MASTRRSSRTYGLTSAEERAMMEGVSQRIKTHPFLFMNLGKTEVDLAYMDAEWAL